MTTKTYKVIFWHGRGSDLDRRDRQFTEQIESICGPYDTENRCSTFMGTLDEFIEQYGRPIIVYPSQDDEDGVIGVTRHSNFGQR
jgi:hypothetical protein